MKKDKILAVGLIALIIALAFSACEQPTDPAHIHQWGEYVVTTAATCVSKGMETRTCILDTTHKETRVIEINPDAHNYQNFVQIAAPLCETDGVETGICTYDNTHIGTRPITALGHDWEDWDEADVTISLQPTCTTVGNGKRACLRNGCDSEDVAEGNIPALGHDYQNWTQTTAPTCTAAGVDTGTCIRDQVTTTRIGAAINPNAHDYQWVTTTAPSLIEEGIDKELCSRCADETGNTRVSFLPITTTQEWNNALAMLIGKIGRYTLTISGNVGVSGTTVNSFGTTRNGGSLTVTLQGSGTLSLNSNGNMIRIFYGQTLIIDSSELTLKGLTYGQNGATQNNNDSLIYVVGGALELRNGTISGNNAGINRAGGGVYVESHGTTGYIGTFIMNGGTISGNAATCGGGVFISGDRATFIMNDGTISGNTSSDNDGGGVVISGDRATFTMNGGEISGNTVSRRYGGGVYVNGTFTMNDGTISGNRAVHGCGVYVEISGIFLMKGGDISGNTGLITNSDYEGGGVYVNGTFTMSGGTISGNTAYSGGGVYGDFTMIGGEISGNTAFFGGGVNMKAGGIFAMSGGTISGNTATFVNNVNGARGGGVFVSGTFTMSGGTISGNTVINNSNFGNGGGVSIVQGGNGQFIKTGGTIYGYSESDTINSNVVKNSSGTVLNEKGHAVYLDHSNNSFIRRKETTSQHGDNLSCVWNASSSTIEGEWDK